MAIVTISGLDLNLNGVAVTLSSIYPSPFVVVSKISRSFIESGINSYNTKIIYLIGNPNLSYDPARGINSIYGFTANSTYYIIKKIDFDLSEFVIPPII